MAKKRLTLPKALEKRVYQQAGSACGFCRERAVTALEAHHIDGDPANNDLKNLLLVCGTCHSKITAGVISEADVRTKKREVEWLDSQRDAGQSTPAVSVTMVGSSYRGDIAQNLTKVVTRHAPRIMHPPGSLGADIGKKGYIDYLISRYFDCRDADKSFGRRRPFSYAEIHRTIQSKFRHRTFFMPVALFERLVEFLQHRIDQTILGRNMASRGSRVYHSYAQHVQEQHPGA